MKYTKPCLLCQPKFAKINAPLPSNSILPSTFPSDLEYEIAKIKQEKIFQQKWSLHGMFSF